METFHCKQVALCTFVSLAPEHNTLSFRSCLPTVYSRHSPTSDRSALPVDPGLQASNGRLCDSPAQIHRQASFVDPRHLSLTDAETKSTDIGSNLSDPVFHSQPLDLAAVLERARSAGIAKQILTGSSLTGSREVLALARQHGQSILCQ